MDSSNPWLVAFASVGWLLLSLVPLAWLLSFGYFWLSLPLRRQRRASLLLDLVETGAKDGRHIEETIISVSASREPSLGVRFHLLAAHLEHGIPFRQALDMVPGLLPAPIIAMLKAGVKLGDLQKILPACRQLLNDAVSQARGAMNYLVVLAFLTTPVTVYVFIIVSIYILPKFTEVATELGVPASLGGVEFMLAHQALFISSQLALLFFLWLLALLYIGGPRLKFWGGKLLGQIPDAILYSLPWRRKRMQRDFSTMLAVLLDADVPESEALELAGECTANAIFQQRVARARAGLQQGLKLTQAVEMIDDSGEFRWRLTQAIGRQGGFVEAIAGWKDALDAKAFQQEQAAAQIATTTLVLINGAFVAVIALGIFGALVSIINAGILW